MAANAAYILIIKISRKLFMTCLAENAVLQQIN